MGDKTSIEWTDMTWNPIRGCSRVSEGCRHCYAEGVAARFSGPGQAYEGLAVMGNNGPRWTGKVEFIEEHLLDPIRKRKPTRIFVNSMSDLFHESVPDEWIDRIFAVMIDSPRHTFQILTKRPERMRHYLSDPETRVRIARWVKGNHRVYVVDANVTVNNWPASNIWCGTSVEDQKTADERIPLLLQTPAAVRWISAEPLLGPVDLFRINSSGRDTDRNWASYTNALHGHTYDGPYFTDEEDRYEHHARLSWVVAGGESGHGARPMHPDWARSLRDQCVAAGVAFHFKQWGEHHFDPDAFHWERVTGSRYPEPSDPSFALPRWELHTPSGANAATVWDDGTWHTWDEDGCGGENSTETTVERAKAEALKAVTRQVFREGWHPREFRIGKKKSGRVLDGRTWDEYPVVEVAP